jgi:hypothetical protein
VNAKAGRGIRAILEVIMAAIVTQRKDIIALRKSKKAFLESNLELRNFELVFLTEVTGVAMGWVEGRFLDRR